MTTPRAFFFRAALFGVGLMVALGARSQGPASIPATKPTTSPAASQNDALPCVSSTATRASSRLQMPLPPELELDLAVVNAGPIRVRGKAFPMKPYEIEELKIGPVKQFSKASTIPLSPSALPSPFWVEALNLPALKSIPFEKLGARQDFSFQIAKKEVRETPPIGVRCSWVTALMKGVWTPSGFGGEAKPFPGQYLMDCELSEAPESEPWRLMLWVGTPSNRLSPDFPSGGGLVRGAVRYDATSTNVMKPSLAGLKARTMTGTLFTKEGHPVAAVERLLPGRILMQCSLPPADQSLFVAVGAALLVRDMEASVYER